MAFRVSNAASSGHADPAWQHHFPGGNPNLYSYEEAPDPASLGRRLDGEAGEMSAEELQEHARVMTPDEVRRAMRRASEKATRHASEKAALADAEGSSDDASAADPHTVLQDIEEQLRSADAGAGHRALSRPSPCRAATAAGPTRASCTGP